MMASADKTLILIHTGLRKLCLHYEQKYDTLCYELLLPMDITFSGKSGASMEGTPAPQTYTITLIQLKQ